MLSYKSYNIKKLSPILFYYLRFLINRLSKEDNKVNKISVSFLERKTGKQKKINNRKKIK